MEFKKELQALVNHACFKLISEPAHKLTAQGVILPFLEAVEKLSRISLIGLYTYNEWKKTFELISRDGSSSSYAAVLANLQAQITRQQWMNMPLELRQTHPGALMSVVLEMTITAERTCYLVVLSEDAEVLEAAELQVIKETVIEYLSVIERYFLQAQQQKRQSFLLELTSKLRTTLSDRNVLRLISEALSCHYPHFKHQFLLSYDHKFDDDLPIKLMDYSDCLTQEISTRAFTTGEIQFERRLDKAFAYIYAPLTGDQGVYGVIQLILPRQYYFPNDHVAFMKQFAHIAGRALESTMLYEHAALRITDLQLINTAIHELNSNLKLVELIAVLKNKITSICRPTEIGFIYINEEQGHEHIVADGSTSFFKTDQGALFTDTLIKEIVKDREAIFCSDYTTTCPEASHKSTMVLPMVHADKYFGFIVILHEEEAYFSFDNFKLIQSLVHHSSLVFSNTLLKNKLEVLATTDHLTKLHSRGYLDERLQRHMDKNHEGTMILLDVDDFKEINDTYGHAVGDEVLQQIGEIIQQKIGLTDIAARWGGEEFAIFLPHKTLAEGIKLAEALRDEVNQRTRPRVSFSCGVTTWHDHQVNSIQTILSRADKALYSAKDSGKNCVKIQEGVS